MHIIFSHSFVHSLLQNLSRAFWNLSVSCIISSYHRKAYVCVNLSKDITLVAIVWFWVRKYHSLIYRLFLEDFGICFDHVSSLIITGKLMCYPFQHYCICFTCFVSSNETPLWLRVGQIDWSAVLYRKQVSWTGRKRIGSFSMCVT